MMSCPSTAVYMKKEAVSQYGELWLKPLFSKARVNLKVILFRYT